MRNLSFLIKNLSRLRLLILGIVIITIFLITSGVIVVSMLLYENRPESKNQVTQKSSSRSHYTLDEVSKHSTSDDCWIVVDGRIYDFSNLIENHPGKVLVEECGTDATKYFVEGEAQFGSFYPLLEYLYIGEVE